MTLDAAIKHAETVAEEHTKYNIYGGFESCDECATDHRQLAEWLKELKQLKEQEPCDVVSRRAAIEIARINIHYGLDKEYEYSRELLEKTMAEISLLPPVTPQPKTGHWIRWYGQKDFGLYIENIPHCKCSECGKEYDSHSSQFIKYCCECGAKMVEPQESEES